MEGMKAESYTENFMLLRPDPRKPKLNNQLTI